MHFTILHATPADDGGLIVQGHLATHYSIVIPANGAASVKPDATRTPDADLDAAIAAAVARAVAPSPANLDRLTVSIDPPDRAPRARAVLPVESAADTPAVTEAAAVDAASPVAEVSPAAESPPSAPTPPAPVAPPAAVTVTAPATATAASP